MSYDRPVTTVSEQLDILIRKGLIVPKRQDGIKLIREVGYFRLKGYCLAYLDADFNQFQANVTIDVIREAYRFDGELKSLLLLTCQHLEIHLKAVMGRILSSIYAPVLPANAFFRKSAADGWREAMALAYQRARPREVYVEYYLKRYQQVPIWVDLELSTFGNASRLFASLKLSAQKKIASEYGIRPKYLRNWFHELTNIRNICAHHSRVFGRHLPIQFKLSTNRQPDLPDDSFETLIYVFSRLLSHREFADFLSGLKDLVRKYPQASNNSGLDLNQDWLHASLSLF